MELIGTTPIELESNKILIFHTTQGLSRFIVVNHGKTVAEALRQFLKEIGKSNLEIDKITFVYNGCKLHFINKDKVENFFANKSHILVCNPNDIIGIIKENNIEVNFKYGSITTTIFCEIDEKMKSIFDKFISEIKIKNYDSIFFLYSGIIIKEDLQLNQIINSYDFREKK